MTNVTTKTQVSNQSGQQIKEQQTQKHKEEAPRQVSGNTKYKFDDPDILIDSEGKKYTHDNLLQGITRFTTFSGSIGGDGSTYSSTGDSLINPGVFKRNPAGWNIQRACQWLHDHAAAKSQHICAKYVRMAIEAGGLSTAGRPNWAWKYINYLPTIGFKFIGTVSRGETFRPEPGDIAVYTKGTDKSVPGHICMWTGAEWASDFKQRNMIVYQATNTAYLFRFV